MRSTLCAVGLGLAVLSLSFPAPAQPPLTLVGIGDAGGHGAVLRGNAGLLEAMRTGEHDGGRCNVLVFLGDNFGETGLNVPAAAVEGEASATLGHFRSVLQDLGPANVYGIPGETEYYARMAVEKSALFGLITTSEWPVGLTDRGVRRAAARPEWRFYAHYPASAVYAAGGGSTDSVELIFFDSALLMRTEPPAWTAAFDSLRNLLHASARRPGIGWRILCTHHPLRSAGEHGGYTVWNDEDSTVEYLTGCDRDSNAFRYVGNWIDPEDLCTARYRACCDSMRAALRAGGVTVQAVLSSHDRSLQLLPPDSGGPLQIVSGCGSETDRVRLPAPPAVYSAGRKSDMGRSLPGFVQLRWRDDRMEVTFYNERNGEPIDMANGITYFSVHKDGRQLAGGRR